jgi:hypothetical protein
MKNKYISVRCPSCMSVSQIKAQSMRSDIFFCPVCETGEIENPLTKVEHGHAEKKVSMEMRVLVKA